MRLCEAEGCTRRMAAKGWCHMHYNRVLRHGDPSVAHRMVPRGSSLEYRMELLTDKSGGPEACWPWLGSVDTGGYGVLQCGGMPFRAHRSALEHHAGRKAPDGMLVLHSCDNPPCCNPAHLRFGTHVENAQDMVDRGRCPRKGPPTKLTLDEARELREAYAVGGVSLAALGARFGVSKSLAHLVVNRQGHWAKAAV